MKFWLTVCVGIALVTGISTAMVIWNPETFRGPDFSKKYKPKQLEPATGDKIPKLEFGETLVQIPKVEQYKTGETVFPLRNEGEADLHLRLGAKSCTCAAIRIQKGDKVIARFAKAKEKKQKEDAAKKDEEREFEKVSDAVVGQGNISPGELATLRPGESAEFVIEWDSQDSVGYKGITGEVFSDDPRNNRQTVEFSVRLDISPELLVEPLTLNFGPLRVNQPREETCAIFSEVRDNLEVEFSSASSEYVTAKVRPMTDDEKKRYDAVSGYMATVTVNGLLPYGSFLEQAAFKTNLELKPQFSVMLSGFVEGLITIEPAVLRFGTVPQSGGAMKKALISARVIEEDNALEIVPDKIPYDFLDCKLVRNEESPRLWWLEVTIKPTDYVGTFRGPITIRDKQGKSETFLVQVEGSLIGSSNKSGTE